MIGKTLAHYEILEKIGAGGMGEVYRARDTRLDRIVAIKVLPIHLSEHPQFKQRFEREAHAISNLSHPNICILHDIGHEDGIDYLVMEYLEGETLADRLKGGPLPTDELLRIGVQIADALDKAHQQGVIHRDLKPGNVMVTKAGAKLLDFGLAKTEVASSEMSGLTTTPTMTSPLTAEGTIVGTFQYMAPEQLEGQEVDARSDIFSFGAMLYEMASGKKAFGGKTQASLIASILKDEPRPISAVQPMFPPALERVVGRCLVKDPDERWQTARDLKHELKWIAEGGSQADIPAPVTARRKIRERLAWAVATASSVVALVAVAFGFGLFKQAAVPDTIRFQIPPPADVTFAGSPRISPDGRHLAYNVTDGSGQTLIWVRSLNTLEARPLPGTERANRPFWSPDSRYLGFFAGGKLKKIDVSGGPPQTLCDAATGADGTWSPEGVILFDGGSVDSIRMVSAAGGVPAAATTLDRSKNEYSHAWPHFLPDGRHFLFLAYDDQAEEGRAKIGSIDSEESKVLSGDFTRLEYSPSGHLLFVRDGTLMVLPFDSRSQEITGEPFPVAEGVGFTSSGLAHFSISQNGILTYRSGGAGNSQLLWVDRTGRQMQVVGAPADYSEPWLSPDGERIAVTIQDPRTGSADIWLLEPSRAITSRFTFDPGDDTTPVWSPDGEQILFSSDRGGQTDLFQKHSSGAGDVDSVFGSKGQQSPSDWSSDGRFRAFLTLEGETGFDIFLLPSSGDTTPFAFLSTPFHEVQPRFSPDGRWIAYVSNESGRWEIYVQALDGREGKWQISNNGGTEPQWRGDGKELFYLSPDRKLMSVEVQTGTTFRAGVPKLLFEAPVSGDRFTRNRYSVAPDGQRFLVVAPLSEESLSATTVVVNWSAELAKR